MKPSQEAKDGALTLISELVRRDMLNVGKTAYEELGPLVAEALDKARREEREECAQIADSYELEHSNPDPTFQNAFEIGCDDMSLAIAESIRARESY